VLHRCSEYPEVVLNNSEILQVSSLIVGLKLTEEAHRRSTITGTFYKREATGPMCGALLQSAAPKGWSCGGMSL
jgi:hypothetical protein